MEQAMSGQASETDGTSEVQPIAKARGRTPMKTSRFASRGRCVRMTMIGLISATSAERETVGRRSRTAVEAGYTYDRWQQTWACAMGVQL